MGYKSIFELLSSALLAVSQGRTNLRFEKRSDRSFIIIVILINDVNGSNGQQPFLKKSHPLKIGAVDKLVEHKDTAIKENDYYNHDHDNDVLHSSLCYAK